VAPSDFRRREKSALNLETQPSKLSVNSIGAGEQAADILDEYGPTSGLGDESAGGGPQVAVVVVAATLSGKAPRLARDAAKDDVHEATKAAAWDGSGIRPYRRWSQITRFNRFRQSRDGDRVPLHV